MNTSLRSALLLTGLITLAACGQTPSSSTPNQTRTKPALTGVQPSETGKWFIEFEGEPSGSLSAQSLSPQAITFQAQAARAGLQYQQVASYNTLFNGLSIASDTATVARLSKLPGVKNIYPVIEIKAPVVQQSETVPNMTSAAGMTGADNLRDELGLTGKGIKVAVIDSGIDLTHPAFQGRVMAGYDFVGDTFGSKVNGVTNYTPAPDDSPQDCGGHGTHVSGIIGANDPNNGFKGVAPDVMFGAYKVFGCEGSTNSDIMLQAMERAYRDGMQVLNMSIGAAFQWPDYPTAKAASRLVKNGVIVTVSAGNSGDKGQYATGAPSLGENVISVASVDNTKMELRNFTLSTDQSRVGFNTATGAPPFNSGDSFTVTKLASSTSTTANDGCNVNGVSPFAPGSLTGQAVLIRRGTCSFREKAVNAQNAGATGVILYNNAPGYLSPTVAPSVATDTFSISIPVVMITQEDGVKMSGILQAGTPLNIFVNPDLQVYGNPTGNTMSDFSSYGVSPDLELKPDVSAPGGLIKSTYPLSKESTGYAVLSGTSMASPHMAGIAAQMLQANPGLQSKDARALFQNTATVRNLFLNNAVSSYIAPVQKEGAGMVNAGNALAAMTTGAQVTPSKLSLGESDTFTTRTKVLVVKNNGPLKMTYTLRHVPALSLNANIYAPSPTTNAATMSVSVNGGAAATVDGTTGPTITINPSSSAEIAVTVTPPSAPVLGQYGGYLSLQSALSTNLTVPYSGFIGDYQKLPVLNNVLFGTYSADFPALYDPSADYIWEESETATPDDIVYTFKQEKVGTTNNVALDRPQVWVHFGMQVRTLTVELLDANDVPLGNLYEEDFWGRNADRSYGVGLDTFDTFPWDGKMPNTEVDAPNGVYRMRVKVLKALGDASNPAHYETYTSQKFTVQR